MPRGLTPIAVAAAERLVEVVAWMARSSRGEPMECPTNGELGQRFQISSSAAAELIQRAQREGYIQMSGMAGSVARRTVRVLAIPAPPAPLPSAPDAEQPLPGDGRYEFERWLRRAKRGDRRTYFTGHLAEARGARRKNALALEEADTAAWAEQEGLVLLVTERGEGGCVYVAIRTAKPVR